MQWSEAQRTLAQLRPLRRSYGVAMTFGSGPQGTIPLFVASYTGWKTVETVRQHVDGNPGLAGVLIIDKSIFVSSQDLGTMVATGPWALWGLICCLHSITNSLQSASTNPASYAE